MQNLNINSTNHFRYFISKFFLWCFCLLLLKNKIGAQSNTDFRFKSPNDSNIFFQQLKNFSTNNLDSLALMQLLRGGIAACRNIGFLESSVDSFYFQDFIDKNNLQNDSKKAQKLTAWIHIGERYEWLRLENGNIEKTWLQALHFDPRTWQQQIFSPQNMLDIEKKILDFAENHGFPFAKIWIDSFQILPNGKGKKSATAKIFCQKGHFITLDTLSLEPTIIATEGGKKMDTLDIRISKKFLANYLDFQEGALYSAQKMRLVSARLAELPYLREVRPATVRFEGDKAILVLYLAERKASVADGIIGIQPNNDPTTGATKFNIIATGNADFQNLLGRGERISAKLEQTRAQSPNLDTKFYYPFIFDLPFGTDINFSLYKRDTTYLDTRLEVGVRYLLRGGDFFKFFWQNNQASNLTIQENVLLATRRLPAALDITLNALGVEWQRSRLDYRFNPRRGSVWSLKGSVGERRVRRNVAIEQLRDAFDPNFKFSSLYDSINLKNFQFKIETQSTFYIPLMQRSTLRLSLVASAILGSQLPSQSEQFRIGGNRLLRGFDEESFFSSRFGVATLEYRLLIGRNAFLYTFADIGYLEDITPTKRHFDLPRGFGAGISFETGAGILALNLAIGATRQNAVDFRNIKTHFGYISLF